MILYVDESGFSGNKDILKINKPSNLDQRFFVLGAIFKENEKNLESLLTNFMSFKKRNGIKKEIKSTDIFARKNNLLLKDFLENVYDDSFLYISIIDKVFQEYTEIIYLLLDAGFINEFPYFSNFGIDRSQFIQIITEIIYSYDENNNFEIYNIYKTLITNNFVFFEYKHLYEKILKILHLNSFQKYNNYTLFASQILTSMPLKETFENAKNNHYRGINHDSSLIYIVDALKGITSVHNNKFQFSFPQEKEVINIVHDNQDEISDFRKNDEISKEIIKLFNLKIEYGDSQKVIELQLIDLFTGIWRKVASSIIESQFAIEENFSSFFEAIFNSNFKYQLSLQLFPKEQKHFFELFDFQKKVN